ncbi:MAG: putative metalloprotease CJM1_0395 family protein [Gammaproteobacteria bacterium]|nr:putative metalloprotease CJM1_0395 family protein [Gammaproteobacteria bacterium]
MVEIISQQYLNTSRGVETSSPASVNVNLSKPQSTADNFNSEEATPEQKREQRQYEQSVAQQLQKLQSRDREVRAHEAAHVAAGGRYVSAGPSYTYQRGPNGRFYAIGGEVQIDVSAIPSNPEATLTKAEVVQRAALAPAQPSPQDLRVASNAASLASRARVEIAIQQRELQQAQAQQREKSGADNSDNGADITSTNTSSVTSGYSTASLAAPADEVFDIVA